MGHASYTTTYHGVRKFQERSAKAVARRLVRHAVVDAFSVADRLAYGDEPLRRNRVQFLYLHFVMADEEAGFRRLIELLSRDHTFVTYSEAIRLVQNGNIDKPYLAVSFDDGLRNCLRAAGILEEYGVSACFFVCDSMAEETRDERITEFCSRELSIPPADFLSWSDMEHLIESGHEIGNHTRAHKTLRGLGGGELQDAVYESLTALRSRLGDDVRHFAWPRGRFFHVDPATTSAVFDAGHESCASAERGCHVAGPPCTPEEVCIRRDHVIAAWPLRHTIHFLRRNSMRAGADSSLWPPEWQDKRAGAR